MQVPEASMAAPADALANRRAVAAVIVGQRPGHVCPEHDWPCDHREFHDVIKIAAASLRPLADVPSPIV